MSIFARLIQTRMKKAIQFGAGNIGRGFIGAVLSQAGYQVTFADVVASLIDQINERKEYTVRVTDTNSYDIRISNIKGVLSGSDVAVAEVVDADIITTAVGIRILKFVAPTIAKGLKARMDAGVEKPLNIMCCENGLKATSQLKELVFDLIDEPVREWTETHVGFPDTAVDRIVPPVHCEVPLDVAVEEFFEWDAERSDFVGGVPDIPGMVPVDNLLAYVERKLFTLNTGHATLAYLGKLKGYETIGQSIADEGIREIVRQAMQQSGEGLIRKFGFDRTKHYEYIESILVRFQNPYLQDDCNRVGREPLRKLSANDRLVLPMLTAREYGLPYDKLLVSIAACLHFYNPDDVQSLEMRRSLEEIGIEGTLVKYSGIPEGDPVLGEIAAAYAKVEAIV